MSYTTRQQVADYLHNDIDSSLNTTVDRYIAAMTRHIDKTIGYTLFTDELATFKYDGSGRRVQRIKPTHGITEVTLDGTVVEPLAWPYNRAVKTELRLETIAYWTHGFANVEVTGKHSLQAELPEDIQHACTVFVALILKQLRDQDDGVASEKIGDYAVSFKDKKDRLDFEQAKDIVMSYRPIVF